MSKFIQILVGAFALTLAVAQQARADVQIMPPTQPVAGQSQLSWAEEWYRWVSGIPAANNPIHDTTGNNARVNNNRPVFFLAGTFGTGPVARKIKVPYGKPVIFPVLNQAFAAVNFETGNYDPSPCTSPLTVKCAIGALSISKAVNMSVQIDGVTLDNQQVTTYRQTSTAFFAVAVSGNNVWGTPVENYNRCCARQPLWVQDGYWITLVNLSPGTHLLHFHGEIPEAFFSVDVTDTLDVQND